MSSVTKIGVNLTKLQNLTAPNFNISNDPKVLINELPERVNNITNGYFGMGVLISLFVMLFYTLADKTPNGGFAFSNLRAFTLTSGICAIFGIIMIQTGIIYDFKAVGLFIGLTVLSLITISFTENKQ
jgi:hypothetical protein